MKKKILTTIVSLFNCLCLVLLCTSLTGCAEETLSEADSQLFQIACEHMAQEALTGNEASTIKYASMVCDYDPEKNNTKVVATEIRANGYNTPYEDGNFLAFNVTFVTTLKGSATSKVTASAFATFNLASHQTTKKIANFIFCSVDPKAKLAENKSNCVNDGFYYSKQAINAEDFVYLVRNGSLDGYNISLAANERIPSFKIYESQAGTSYNKGLKDLHIVRAIYDGSYHEAATSISSKQKQLCATALSMITSKIQVVDEEGQPIEGYRKAAMEYVLSKLGTIELNTESNPKLTGSLVDEYYSDETDYSFDTKTGVAEAGCQATINLTLKNSYQYGETYTFRVQRTTESVNEMWTIVDGTSYKLTNDVYELATY